MRKTMSASFDEPVTVRVGLGFPCELHSLDALHEFLCEWAPSRRGPLHASAVRACEAARNGLISGEAARSRFQTFAAASGILWEDEIDPAVAASAQPVIQSNHIR